MVQHLVDMLRTTATVIGCFVIFAWVVLIVWLVSMTLGEFRFNRLLKKRKEREFDNLRSSWLLEMREQDPFEAGAGSDPRFDTTELPIGFRFHPDEDEFPTEETGAVFDISERYPNEFA